MRDYKGRIIEVHRHFNMLALAQNDPEVKAWYGEAFRAVGPYYEHGGKAVATGLTFEEQKILLPIVLGIEAEDKDFRRAVTTYYHEFMTRVPKEGLKLQISLENDNDKLSKSNLPLNIPDYLAYRHILNHREVSQNKAEAEANYVKKFYLVDPDGVTKEAVRINSLEDKAVSLYMRYKEDVVKTDQVLVMLGVNINKMTHDDKVLKLKDFAQSNPELNKVEQAEAFQRFITVCEDKDLEYKYLIQEMVGTQYLKRVGTNIVITESSEKIGDNIEDAVLYLKNPKNSRQVLIMKAQYETLVKRGKEYLPKPLVDLDTVKA
jgi:hypothetical protein